MRRLFGSHIGHQFLIECLFQETWTDLIQTSDQLDAHFSHLNAQILNSEANFAKSVIDKPLKTVAVFLNLLLWIGQGQNMDQLKPDQTNAFVIVAQSFAHILIGSRVQFVTVVMNVEQRLKSSFSDSRI